MIEPLIQYIWQHLVRSAQHICTYNGSRCYQFTHIAFGWSWAGNDNQGSDNETFLPPTSLCYLIMQHNATTLHFVEKKKTTLHFRDPSLLAPTTSTHASVTPTALLHPHQWVLQSADLPSPPSPSLATFSPNPSHIFKTLMLIIGVLIAPNQTLMEMENIPKANQTNDAFGSTVTVSTVNWLHSQLLFPALNQKVPEVQQLKLATMACCKS